MIECDQIEIKAIKIDDILIYKKNLPEEILIEFKSDPTMKFLVENIPSQDSIFISRNNSNEIHLMEWKKYKVLSLSSSELFKKEDFIKIGEFGTPEYGTLLYKNCVGISFFKNTKLIIDSRKISSSEMDKLSDVVNSIISNLTYDHNQPTYSMVTRNKRKITDIEYHVYLLIMNMFRTKDKNINIFSNFNLIDNNINRQMISLIEYENINNVSYISEESIIDIYSGGSSFIPCNNPNNKLAITSSDGNKYLPKEIIFEQTIDNYDNNENRFIKYFFCFCLSILEKFQEKFIRMKELINYEIIYENKKYIGEINRILNNSFLKNVGELENIPMYSTVLTRREGYRQIFKLYVGIKSIPTKVFNGDEIEEIIGNKSLDVLYENYCYFTMARLLSELYGESFDTKTYKVNRTNFSKSLKKRTNSNYFIFNNNKDLPTVIIYYNKNYGKDNSYSKNYDPDIAIEIFNEFNIVQAIYLFDAKFKISFAEITNYEDDEEIEHIDVSKTYNYDDISKMHTYKDAIKLARGAFILYPGDKNMVYYEDDSIPKNEYQAVGALCLRIDQQRDFDVIKGLLKSIITSYK